MSARIILVITGNLCLYRCSGSILSSTESRVWILNAHIFIGSAQKVRNAVISSKTSYRNWVRLQIIFIQTTLTCVLTKCL
jgi:hypothetical protein